MVTELYHWCLLREHTLGTHDELAVLERVQVRCNEQQIGRRLLGDEGQQQAMVRDN